MRRSAPASALLTLAALTALTTAQVHAQSDAAEAQAPLNVVVTIGMLADLVEQVGGDCVAVNTMMGPGIDPHLYQASARDVHDLNEAELILYSGFSLEGQLGKVFDRFSRIKPTAAVSEQAVSDDQLIHTQDAYGVDPHLWMDAGLWAQNVPVIAELLGEQRPRCTEAIQQRAEAYQVSLAELDDWIQASIDSIPAEQRILVTAHDAFGYYGRAYGIEVAGIQGMSTATETGVADIRRMAELVIERGVPAMFVESTINPRTVQAVIDAAADQDHSVRIGGQLYSDAMGAKGTLEGTYIGMLKSNTERIVSALGGQPAPLPDTLAATIAAASQDTDQ